MPNNQGVVRIYIYSSIILGKRDQIPHNGTMKIYRPKGKAGEYSPNALNIYKGCDHHCSYCYVDRFQPGHLTRPAEFNEDGFGELDKQLEKTFFHEQILLCFTGDAYCKADVEIGATRKILKRLFDAGSPVAILTKGGRRCLRDIDLFCQNRERVKVGATLTFDHDGDSHTFEPGASLPGERINMLRALKTNGIRTWASMEPVIEPGASLRIMEEALPFLDEIKVGRWNHSATADLIDWRDFGMKAVELVRRFGVDLYVKHDLRICLPRGFLKPEEQETRFLNVVPRPAGNEVMLPGFGAVDHAAPSVII